MLRHRWPKAAWLMRLTALAALLYFGGGWLLAQIYPLHYRAVLFHYAQANGIDPYLVAAMVRSESRFRPDATSSTGARGLMQIMPETGEWLARQLDLPYTPEMLYNPEYNIRLGCWYLASLRREFSGDLVLALAAYNAGRTNVGKWVREKRWTGELDEVEQIPFPETRRYVSQVLFDFKMYRRIYAWNE